MTWRPKFMNVCKSRFSSRLKSTIISNLSSLETLFKIILGPFPSLSSPSMYQVLAYYKLYLFILFTICPLPYKVKLHDSKFLSLLCSLCCTQYLEQCPVQDKCSGNICWKNEWMSEWIGLDFIFFYRYASFNHRNIMD